MHFNWQTMCTRFVTLALAHEEYKMKKIKDSLVFLLILFDQFLTADGHIQIKIMLSKKKKKLVIILLTVITINKKAIKCKTSLLHCCTTMKQNSVLILRIYLLSH